MLNVKKAVTLAVMLCLVGGVRPASGDLVAYWPFDGDASDASGSGNAGIEYGGVTYTDGMAGQAVTLDGVTGYVEMAEVTNLDGFANFSIALWIRPDTDLGPGSSRQDILYKGRPVMWEASYDLCYGNTAGTFAFDGHSTNYFDEVRLSHDADFVAGEWFHVLVTYDGVDQPKFYVNGLPVGEVTGPGMSGALLDISLPLIVGRRPDNNYYFSGAVDELRIYNHVLSSEEMADLLEDCDGNGVLDFHELPGNDCNGNGVLDACEPDFDGDGLIDDCDPDIDDDGVPNELDVCDYTPPGAAIVTDPDDALYGTLPYGDVDGDCDCDLEDFALFSDVFTGPNGR